MLRGNTPARIAFTIAIFLNLFIAPWWLTVLWCLVGCFLFPVYLESVVAIVLFDSVFVPGGVPMLTVLVVITAVLTSAIFYSTNYHVDFS